MTMNTPTSTTFKVFHDFFLPENTEVSGNVLIEIKTPYQKRENFYSPLNLVIVLDRSKSMSGNPIYESKKAINMIIDKLEPGDIFSLITYSSNAENIISNQRIKLKQSNHKIKQHLKEIVNEIQCYGATNMFEGIKFANLLMEYGNDDTEKHGKMIFLFTDGKINRGITDENKILEYVKGMYVNDKIICHCFGLGNSYNETFLRKISNCGNGLYYYISNTEKIQKIFKKAFLLSKSIQSSNAILTIYSKTSKIGYIYGIDNKKSNEYSSSISPSPPYLHLQNEISSTQSIEDIYGKNENENENEQEKEEIEIFEKDPNFYNKRIIQLGSIYYNDTKKILIEFRIKNKSFYYDDQESSQIHFNLTLQNNDGRTYEKTTKTKFEFTSQSSLINENKSSECQSYSIIAELSDHIMPQIKELAFHSSNQDKIKNICNLWLTKLRKIEKVEQNAKAAINSLNNILNNLIYFHFDSIQKESDYMTQLSNQSSQMFVYNDSYDTMEDEDENDNNNQREEKSNPRKRKRPLNELFTQSPNVKRRKLN